MALGIKIEKTDGVYYVRGHIDETSDFVPLMAPKDDPLRINLRDVQSINSLGLRRLIECMRHLDGRNLELAECPAVFVEAVNVIPLVVGGQSQVARIRSVHVPFNCASDHETMQTIAIKDVTVGDTISMPKITCAVCRQPMDPALDSTLDEFFFFLMA